MALTGQETGKPDLLLARQNIDLLELMQEKTRGNLSAQERQMLEQLLYELRMRYVEAGSEPGPESRIILP